MARHARQAAGESMRESAGELASFSEVTEERPAMLGNMPALTPWADTPHDPLKDAPQSPVHMSDIAAVVPRLL
jgi:hypothetical protein